MEEAGAGLRATSRMRLRVASWLISLALTGAVTALLIFNSTTLIQAGAPSIRVFVEAVRRPPPQQRARVRAAAMRSSPSEAAPVEAQPDLAALANELVCFTHDVERRRAAHCPEEQRPAWNPAARRPGDAPHQSSIPAFSVGERVLRTPGRCEIGLAGPGIEVCRSLYPDPPPPSRTAQQICEASHLGGPCTPPPFTGPTYTRPPH